MCDHPGSTKQEDYGYYRKHKSDTSVTIWYHPNVWSRQLAGRIFADIGSLGFAEFNKWGKWKCCGSKNEDDPGCEISGYKYAVCGCPWNSRGCIEEYSTRTIYTCCGYSESSSGCKSKDVRYEWSCCDKSSSSASPCVSRYACGTGGCQSYYSCCQAIVGSNGCRHACCKQQIGAHGCLDRCVVCHGKWNDRSYAGCTEVTAGDQTKDHQVIPYNDA